MKLIKVLILSLTFSFLLNSCGAIAYHGALKNTTLEKGAIPPDFGDEETVLICILQGRNSRDNYMKKHIINNYKGKYEFVLEAEVLTGKYSNTDIYRFIFDYGSNSYRSNINNNFSTNNINESVAIKTSSYHIIDRKSGKIYGGKVNSSYFSKLIKAYSINMEKARLLKTK